MVKEKDKIKVVIIDDEQDGREVLETLLRRFPQVDLIAVSDGAESGMEAICKGNPDLVFLDIKMPRKSGIDMARELKKSNLRPMVVFVTAYDKFAIEAIRLAALDFLLKPVDPDELQQVIEKYQAKHKRVSVHQTSGFKN